MPGIEENMRAASGFPRDFCIPGPGCPHQIICEGLAFGGNQGSFGAGYLCVFCSRLQQSLQHSVADESIFVNLVIGGVVAEASRSISARDRAAVEFSCNDPLLHFVRAFIDFPNLCVPIDGLKRPRLLGRSRRTTESHPLLHQLRWNCL